MSKILNVSRLRKAIESQGKGYTSLAKIAKISRAQLHRLLATNHPKVRERTLNSLADAVGLTAAELQEGSSMSAYRDWVRAQHGFVDFRGIGIPHFQRQSLNAVFVEPDMAPAENSAPGECDVPGENGFGARRRPNAPLSATESVATHDRVVILGHPGSGKTTLLRRLALAAATGETGGAQIPVYVRLPEFSRAQDIDDRIDLIRFVARMAAADGCLEIDRTLHEELADERRHCVVLLDGLDEVGDEHRRELVIKSVKEFIQKYPRNHFVITSRIVGFDPSPWTDVGFVVLRVLGYGAVQLHEFARKWAKLLPGSKRRTEAEAVSALESVIFSNPRVRALASNPLVLTILVLLNDARGGTLPRRRADLYAKVVDVFLDTWESSKRSTDKFDETFDIDLDAREFRWLLSDLALAMQKADRTLAARWWMVERMREYLQQKLGFDSDDAKDASDRIISYLAERTGLLEERGLDLFGFSHRTLLEYFASLGVINDADSSTSRTVTDILSGYLYNPRWCEVVRLVAAQLTPPVAESLISTVLDDPDPVGRFLRRGALLALRCLSDGTSVPNRRLVSSVFDSLADLGTSKWLGITLATIDALEGFGGTRLDELAQKTILSILDKAKSKLEPEEYTCLFERVHFATVFDQARNKLGPDFDKQAAREVTIEQNGTSIHIMYVNARLRAEHPLAWYKSICSLLRDERNSENFKVLLVHELGRQIATDAHSRRALRKILDSDASAALRAACATALGTVNFGRHDAKLLLRRLSDDQSDRVRAACAAALTHAAVAYPSVRERLVVVLQSSEPAIVRAGAARGLGKVAPTDLAITSALLKLASKRDAEDKLRMASVWSLEEQIGRSSEVTEAFKSWLGAVGSPLVQRGAAQALAMTMAEEAIPWDRQLVERVEHILMNLDEPCPHALESLQALATAREVRRGLRLETVLREAFKSVSDQIELAFVFGSTARSRQSEQSDIDLMVIGKTSLKDLSTPLRNAEKTLGRRITPVIYSRESFQQKYHAGDPFLIDVYRREKIPVIQSANVSSRKELDDELGAMVAERMAATG